MDDIRKLQMEFHNREARINVLVSVVTWARDFKPAYLSAAERQRIIDESQTELRALVDANGGQRKIQGVGAIGR